MIWQTTVDIFGKPLCPLFRFLSAILMIHREVFKHLKDEMNIETKSSVNFNTYAAPDESDRPIFVRRVLLVWPVPRLL